ncbi:hypothetical protein RCG19_20525 [Neobacillus sp. OS1-2]|uniref:hypothetical protein n=1 Tax=Neobacillus sp. OS1-2 TaxID=3070680 RepID=UPI0027DF847B|nr:hypothetical protein [Neobacillus sp. OS1-2]WML39536.1 hypothetical protein RCG19_20525 [Neobacillus sp. OS1-2]
MFIQAVFIDRDGTIGGSDKVIYPGEFELFPNVSESLQQLKSSGALICSFKLSRALLEQRNYLLLQVTGKFNR